MDERRVLERAIQRNLPRLRGSWVLKRSGYEKPFVTLMGRGWTYANQRDFDCTYKSRALSIPLKVELKKCQKSTWFNLLRYTSRKQIGGPRNFTVVLFYQGKCASIVDFVVIPTAVVQARLFANFSSANMIKMLEELPRCVPRQVNALVNLTRSDMVEMNHSRLIGAREQDEGGQSLL